MSKERLACDCRIREYRMPLGASSYTFLMELGTLFVGFSVVHGEFVVSTLFPLMPSIEGGKLERIPRLEVVVDCYYPGDTLPTPEQIRDVPSDYNEVTTAQLEWGQDQIDNPVFVVIKRKPVVFEVATERVM